MKKIFTLFLLFIVIALNAEEYKKIKVYFNSKEDLGKIVGCGVDLSDGYFNKDKSVNIFINDAEYEKLQNAGVKFDILIDSWDKYYKSLPVLSNAEKELFKNESKDKFGVEGFGFGSMGGFYTMSEIYGKLDSMKILFPNLITTKYAIGYTVENRPIYAVKISDNPDVDENEPEVFYNSLIHAREPAAMMAVMYYMYYLLENYGTNPEVTYLVNNREIYFVPLINVDGYEYNRTTTPSGGGMWRKNRKNNGGSYGIDLNRNFGYKWGYDNNGSSNYPADETYRGPSAFSEPESQAIRLFSNARNIKTALNYHTYSNYLLYPWSYANVQTLDEDIFNEYAIDMTRVNGYEYGQPPALLYEVNGCTDDWMYGEQEEKGKIISMTPETGSDSDGFWPSQNRIYPIAQENLSANLYLSWVAGEYVSLNNRTFSVQYFNPGDQNIEMTAVFKNKGLSDAQNVTAKLSSLNSDVVVTNNEVLLNNIPARGEVNTPQPFKFNLGYSLAAGSQVKFLLSTYTNGVTMTVDTLTIVIGTPIYAFMDDKNDPAVLWNITASPVTPKWEATTLSFYSPTTSYTDSKTGQYDDDATVTMTTKDPINLAAMNAPVLSFWTKFEIEADWDCGKIQISTNNGTNWVSLQGQYTKPASGKGMQVPTGSPIYHSLQSDWVNEVIDLSSYGASQIKLKFELKSDGSITKDGWYIDDIGIFSYAIIPVELTSFTADVINNSVSLNWSTATELNNQGFEIEKSNDKHDWIKVGYLQGAGSTSETKNYSFIDNMPFGGKNYYRLIQIDFDGSKKIIAPIEVNYTLPLVYNLEQNFPNPFNPVTKINYSIAEKGFVSLKVYNLIGQVVATLVDGYLEPGNYNADFSGTNLSSGTYFYELKAGNFTSVKKMTLVK